MPPTRDSNSCDIKPCNAVDMRGQNESEGPADIDRGLRWLKRDARRAARNEQHCRSRADRRLISLVRHVGATSPLFADLYQGIAMDSAGLHDLPVTGKAMLMDQFDRWASDRRITTRAVDEFANDDANVGRRFLGNYLYSESSGTSGIRGCFVTEDSALEVLRALGSRLSAFGPRAAAQFTRKRGRSAAILKLEGHHMGAAFYNSRDNAKPDRRVRFFSVLESVPSLSAQLTAMDPASVSSYSSVLVLLAQEQLEGNLRIDPAVLLPFSETMTPTALQTIRHAWPRAVVIDRYVANECMFIATRCDLGWQHLNADWVILEPIEMTGEPTPRGHPSHSVLLTNLFRRVQPIIRYDLGDSVLMRPDRCECGNPLPAFDVLGRSGEIVHFDVAGRRRGISPTVVSVVLDAVDGLAQSQIVRDGDDHLTVRFSIRPGTDRAASGREARHRLDQLLADSGLSHVVVEISDELPQRSQGGKFVRVVDTRRTESRAVSQQCE